MATYPNLSKPITIGKVTIKNRMMMAPMDTGFGNMPDNNLSPEGVEYFVRRAQGGFGLLFSGGTNVDGPVDGVPCILDDPAGFISVGRRLNERLRAYNCKMFIQWRRLSRSCEPISEHARWGCGGVSQPQLVMPQC